MHNRQLLGALALIVALTALWIGIRQFCTGSEGEEQLVITALSVGKADALIVETEKRVILIDAGEKGDGDDVVRELENHGIGRIDLFLVTHFDKDHVGGAAYVMEQMEVASVMMPDYEGERQEYQDFLNALQGHPDVRRVTEPWEDSAGELKLTVYPAEDPEAIRSAGGEYDNDMSLVASICYGDRKFLLTGDIEEKRIRQMLASGLDWRHDWLKMPHHGRYEEALNDLLDAVSPETAVICCSEKNPAEKETLQILEDRGIHVWDTEEQAVVTMCDGEHITVK